MSVTNWNQRFFVTTRGRIITLLRRAARTVDELAETLGLTGNAVRAHLATLERDGLVLQRGARRGNSKPAYVYDLAPAAEQLFPKAYGSTLRQFIAVLSERMEPQALEAVLIEVGRRLAANWQPASSDLTERLAQAAKALNELGGMAEIEQFADSYRIRSYSCPLAIAVQDHPQVCRLLEALLSELVGGNVEPCCEHCETPRCCFIAHPNPA